MLSITERLQTAFDLHQAGAVAEAEAVCRGILGQAPGHGQTLFFLGLLVHQQGKHREAIELMKRCVAAGYGPTAIVHSNLAAFHLAAAMYDEAIAHARQAIAQDPSLSLAHFNLGVALSRRGQLAEAEVALREAVRLSPNHAEARCDLASVLNRLGKFTDALVEAREGTRLAPTKARAHFELGTSHMMLGERKAALPHLQEAIRLQPDFTKAHTNLGITLRDLGRCAEAELCFRESLRLNGSDSKVHVNLGQTLLIQGRIDEACAEFEEAIRLDPNDPRALVALSNLSVEGRFQFSGEQIRRIEEATSDATSANKNRYLLHFALGSVFDKEGDYAKAFEHYRQGNELRKEKERRSGIVYDPAKEHRLIDRLIAVFTPAFFERVRGFGLGTERPIFVVGMMRSGTTLVERILASHPRVHGTGESLALSELVNTLSQRLAMTDRYPECLALLSADEACQLGREYEQALVKQAGEADRLVDKLPANFLNLGLIACILPGARIIHCRRDPVDTCLSCYFQDFGAPVPYSWDLHDVGHYYREYRRLMDHWAQVLPMPIFDLCYEDLTADPETITRKLVAFCGLEWDDRCLAFHENPHPVWTASVLQVRQPIYRTSVGRWRKYEAFIRPLLTELAST